VNIVRNLTIVVMCIGLVSIIVGSVYIAQSVEKSNWMKNAMRQEKVVVGLTEDQVKRGDVVDTPEKAQAAADIIRGHRRAIAPTYQDLLGGGKYDPTNPKHLNYAQALNMENYLYFAVLGFGVTTEIMGTGVFMIIVGIALCGAGFAIYQLSRSVS